jgi:bis(5'-nucleosyl)-tetraphosphatase (symmetrical)
MAVYAIGDVQGCYAELQRLLQRIGFDPAEDRLWFTGDLVNRGPDSLATLRLIKSLGRAAVAVLGNHDLHLLAVAYGASRTRNKDTFSDVLQAPDRDELLDWLRRLPLCHHEDRYLLVHAGLPPQWNLTAARNHAREAEAVLAGDGCGEFLHQMYGDHPDCWSDDLRGWDRLRFIVNSLTRLRYCDAHGRLNFTEKGAPGSQPRGLFPWFEVPGRKSAGAAILFGHWSTLGFRVVKSCYALDTGCLWGGELSALRLDGEMYRVSVPSMRGRPDAASPTV